MSAVTEILTADQLHDLWGAGYTVVRRPVDPLEIDPKLIPAGMSYQWNDPRNANEGWREVPYSRHEGIFAPWGTPGSIEVGRLYLCERPRVEVEFKREQARTRAQQQVDDWATKNAAEGFTGSVRTAVQTKLGELDSDEMRPIGEAVYANPATKSLETTVEIPRDMTSHIASIFKERDRLEAEVVRKDRTLAPGPIADKFYAAVKAKERDGTLVQWWPTLRAILLQIAVDNVRAALKEGKTDE